ncbi:MAG: matrixin family metalloprotease [Gemmatimonadaceae bacterium]
MTDLRLERGSGFSWLAGARRLARVAGCLALGATVFAPSAPHGEELVAEQRDAHIRMLKSCGRRKACIKKAGAAPLSSDEMTTSLQRRTRWSEDQYDNVTVWIAPGENVPLFASADRYMVRNAFLEWAAAGAPVRFVFVSDSSRADVRVLWRDSLPELRAGQMTRLANAQGYLRAATIEMNTRNIVGGAQDTATVRAVAMHEVGHLLGLEHSDDEHDIMAAWVTASELTARDRAAMRVLYDIAQGR